MATDGNTGAVAGFVASILARFHPISRHEPRGVATDGPVTAVSAVLVQTTIEEGDILSPSPPQIPHALPVEEDDGEENEDNDDDEEEDDDAAASIAAIGRSAFADTLAEKFAAQVADIHLTTDVMQQILEYAAAQGARSVSFQQHYLSTNGIVNEPDHHQPSGCIRITLDEHKVGTESAYTACDDWHINLKKLVGNPQLSYSSFLLGGFDSHGKNLVKNQTEINNINWCSGTGLTSSRMTSLKDKIRKIDDPVQKDLFQIEATLLSTELLPLQQSISKKDVNRMLRHFHDVYCWKKILYSLRKDGFNADVLASPPPRVSCYRDSQHTLPSLCPKFTVDLWNPLSKADRRAVHWSTYEDELKNHYGLCLPSKVSS